MMLTKWDNLPPQMRIPQVEEYYNILSKKQGSLILKRAFDVVASGAMLVILSPVFLVLSVMIKLDSKGPVFYRQVRVTTNLKEFKIFKFRTMYINSDKGSKVTVKNDSRVTKVGHLIRNCRLDELPQLIDVLRGTMTFVGTRPEAKEFVEAYTPEMLATFLLPAGITSRASVLYKDETKLITEADDPHEVYINKILPAKMKYNLQDIKNFSLIGEFKTMIMTVLAVLGKEYK